MADEIKIVENALLSDNWCKLNRITFSKKTREGELQTLSREVVNRGHGAAILLFNSINKTIILTKQFRLPVYQNEGESGMLIEACAGMLDDDNPEDCIKRETKEETGYRISNVRKIFESYMSPGIMTEMLHFFVGEYSEELKVSDGGGLEVEHEEIEVLEMQFDEAFDMIASGEIRDAKTIMLLQYAKINHLI